MDNTHYILGYDASCSVCSTTTQRMHDEVGSILEFRPLQSAQMVEYRSRALGPDAPWAPTLVKVQGDSIEAWPGWRMGPELVKITGPHKALQLLSILGQETALPSHGRLSRRSLLRSITGVAAGALILTGLPKPAFASSPTQKPGTPLTADEARAHFLAFLAEKDAKNAFSSDYDLETLHTMLEQQSERFTVGGTKSTTVQGTVINVAAMDNEESAILWCSQGDDRGARNTAAALYVAEADETMSIAFPSINGELLEKEVVSDNDAISAVRAGSDPCGGCKSMAPGSRDKRAILMCHDKMDVACALGTAGCVGCTATCLASAGVACFFCLTTSCGGMLASGGCCDDSKPPYTSCTRCSAI